MKKIVLIFISVTGIISGCSTTKTTRQSSFLRSSYNAGITISPSINTKSEIVALSETNNIYKIFPEIDKVSRIGISSVNLELPDSKKHFSMFKSVKLYLSLPDGSGEMLIASSSGISRYAGNTLKLTFISSIPDGTMGATGVIKPGDKEPSYSSIGQVMSGKLAGVQVGETGNITIRGINNFSSTTPLFVVDGIYRDNVAGINTNDIESIQVLKDAGQTAMYGSRGGNGVVIIKTKRGGSAVDKRAISLDDFARGANVCLRLEYVLRYPLRTETELNAIVNFNIKAH